MLMSTIFTLKPLQILTTYTLLITYSIFCFYTRYNPRRDTDISVQCLTSFETDRVFPYFGAVITTAHYQW